MELGPERPLVLDPRRPGDDERIARAAEMRGDLLAPLERRVHRPRPADREMIVGLRSADLVDVLQDVGRVLRLAVERHHFVEDAVQRPFHRGAVVADLPQDERIVVLADVLQRIDDAADLVDRSAR